MKILQINNCHFRRGGADIAYLNTGELLKFQGHEVLHFSQANTNNEEADTEAYFINRINYFKNSFFGNAISIPRLFYSTEAKNKISHLIIDFKPDIAHIHLHKLYITSSILPILKKHNIPIVITLHDYGMLCPHNLMLDGKMNICKKCVRGTALNCIINKCNRNNIIYSCFSSFEYIFQAKFYPFEKYFNKIIAVSKFGQKLHQESGIFRRKIDHIYNFYPNIELLGNNYPGEYFLYFGRLSKEKGIKTLINAWIKKERKSILKIVGTGEMYEELIYITTKHPNIEITGYKSGDDLKLLIKKAFFIIVPSEWYENNPLTIIEAYANGKPVIGANVGGIPEIIVNNKTGFLFTMKDVNELSNIIEHAENLSPESYKQMSFDARTFANNNFSSQNHYTKLIELYKNAIKEYHK